MATDDKTGRSSTTMSGSEERSVTVTLWTRRPVCGARTTVINRLGRMRTEGLIDDFEVQTWPDELVLSDSRETASGHQRVQGVVMELLDWADERGLTLRPAFEQRSVSPLVGEPREVLTLPMMTLTVSEGETIAGIYPVSDGARTWTVSEYLDRFERQGTTPRSTDGWIPSL